MSLTITNKQIRAGKVGVSPAEELLSNRTSAYVPKCFIDTDPEKTGRQIQGIPVIADDARCFMMVPTDKAVNPTNVMVQPNGCVR